MAGPKQLNNLALVPPPPPQAVSLGVNNVPTSGNPFDALWDEPAAPQQSNPFDSLWQQSAPPQQMQAMPQQQAAQAMKPPPDPNFLAGMTPPPQMPLEMGEPTPTLPRVLLQQADQGAGNVLNWLSGLGPMGKGIVDQGHQRAQEEREFNPLQKAAATLTGLAHGPQQLVQDLYNATLAQAAHSPAATFADDFLKSPVNKNVAAAMPGISGTASQAAGMAVPVAGPELALGANLAKAPMMAQIAARTAAGAAGGAMFGRVGQMGKDYGTYGAVDRKAADEATAEGALFGGGLSLLHLGLEGAGKGIGAAREQGRVNKVMKAAPAGERNITDLLSPSEKAKLGISIKKPAEKPAPTATTEPALDVSGKIVDTTQAPPTGPAKRGTYDFLGAEGETAKAQLEAQDAAEANPFAKVTSIKDFTETVGPTLESATDLPSLMDAKENASKWISKNVKDKDLKERINSTLSQVFNNHAQKLKQARDNEVNQAAIAQRGEVPEHVPPAEPTLTPDEELQAFETKNFGSFNSNLSDYDFGSFKGTLDKEYHQPYAEPFTPKQLRDSEVSAHLDALDATEKAFNKAYETADKSTRGRLTQLKNKLHQQQQALVNEKMRREYRKAKGHEGDWPLDEEAGQAAGHQEAPIAPQEAPAPENLGHEPGQPEVISQAPEPENLTKEPVNYTSKTDEELRGLMADNEHADAALGELDRRYPEPAKLAETPMEAPAEAPTVKPAEQETPVEAPQEATPEATPTEIKPETTPPADDPAGDTVWEGNKIIVKHVKKGGFYQTYDKTTGEKLYTGNGSKSKQQAITNAQKRDTGELTGSAGQRNDRAAGITLGEPNESYQKPVGETTTDVKKSTASDALKSAFDGLNKKVRAYHEARAEYRAWENAYRNRNGLSILKKPVRMHDHESEAIIKAAAADLSTPAADLGVEVNTTTPAQIPDRQFKAGDNAAQILKEKWAAYKAAEKEYNGAREGVQTLMHAERENIPYSLSHRNKGFEVNARFVGKGKLAKAPQHGTETEVVEGYKEVQTHLKEHPEVAAQVESEPEAQSAIGAFATTLVKEFSDLPKDSLLAATDWGMVAAGALKIVRALRAAGQAFDPRSIAHFLGNEFNSDKYRRMAHPQFVALHNESMGKLDLALQGVEKLHTADEREAWMKNRYADPADIRAGKNGTSRLSPPQREALVKQNAVLDSMTDMFQTYAQVLKNQGYQGNGLKSLVGKNNLLRAIETDLKQLDPRRGRGSNWIEDMGKGVTHGIYDMYVTGNWPIHQLHAIEASSVGLAYHPKALASAVKSLAFDPSARAFADSFEGSSGNMKRIKEESDSVLGNKWNKLQSKVLDGTVKLFGGPDDASNKLAHNKGVDFAGDIVEGSIAETGKLHLMRTMSAHIAADEMKYSGGGQQLMKDMVDVLHNPNAMSGDDQLEAASRIVYHMNQMIGYSPAGFNDLNIFGRLAAKTGPIAKWVAPFTTTRITQSRVLTKFITGAAQAAKSGDIVGAGKGMGQALTMLGTIALIGGRSAVPREFQDALHAADPKTAKAFLQAMDHINVIGGLLGTEVEHVTPQLMVPAYLGDNFMTQIMNSGTTAIDGKGMPQVRAVATLLALLGVGSIANRMGTSTILKLGKALGEGFAGEKQVFAARLTNSLDAAKHTTTAAQKVLKKGGVNIKVPNDSDIIGKEVLPANPISRLWETVRTGVPLDAAHFINAVRDDYAFGDKLHSMDSKAFETAQRQLDSIRKGADDAIKRAAGDKDKIHEIRERTEPLMQGYWERTFDKYMQQKELNNGKQENAKATTHAEA